MEQCNTKIVRYVEVEITPTPLELAEQFCEMNNDDQASFFNYIETFSNKWEVPFVMQIQSIQDSNKLTTGGKHIMMQIGESRE